MSGQVDTTSACTCEVERSSVVQRRFEVAPAAGGGTVAWTVAFARLLARLLPLPVHCAVLTQQPNQRYVQLMIGHGRARVEASSNAYLLGDFRLSEPEERHLAVLGFSRPVEPDSDRTENWWFDHEPADPVRIADVLAHTMIAVMAFNEHDPILIDVFGAEDPCAWCVWGDEPTAT